jgi:hypothetical protein
VSNSFNNQASLVGAQLPPGTNNIVWQVTDIGGNSASCSLQVQVNLFTSLAGEEKVRIEIHPNPVRDWLRIQADEVDLKSLCITDLSGRIVFEKTSVGMEEFILMNSFPSGIYQLQLKTGTETIIRKFMKE